MNLKRKIRELLSTVNFKQEEIDQLKRNIRSTKLNEIEIEMKVYVDESTRLRHQLEEVIKSKDTFADPEEMKIIESRFQQQDLLINQLRSENNDMAQAFNNKEEENAKLREMYIDIDKKIKAQKAV